MKTPHYQDTDMLLEIKDILFYFLDLFFTLDYISLKYNNYYEY